MIHKPCMSCGDLTAGTYCDTCRPPHPPKPAGHLRGYDWAWRRLSKRARRLQPFCSDCGTTADLTTDHSPQAWERKAAGLPIRLADVDVLCRPCNARRGAARGPQARRDPGGSGSVAAVAPPALRHGDDHTRTPVRSLTGPER